MFRILFSMVMLASLAGCAADGYPYPHSYPTGVRIEPEYRHHHHRRHHGHENHQGNQQFNGYHCPPGQRKKGRCW